MSFAVVDCVHYLNVMLILIYIIEEIWTQEVKTGVKILS